VHYVGITFGASTISYYVASLLLANLFFYLALVVFYCLLRKEGFETTVTRNALFYLAFYPYALFFFTGYTESLFLLLCLTTFFCLQHERYWLAGLCGFLAALTRSPGVLLVVPFIVVITQRFWSSREGQVPWQQKLLACFPLVLIPLGVGAFMLYLGITKGHPLAFSTEEAQFWHRYLTFPLTSFITAIQTFSYLATPDLRLLNLLDLVFTLIPLAILASGWRRLPLHYSLFALAMALFSLSYPQGKIEPLTATPRYMMVIFPIIVILATWGKRPHLDRLILACFLPLFAINSVLFINHYWVA
jgi:hypothetical protein